MKFDIVRAWKDTAYRQSLSADDLALLPANPVGEIELSDAELESIQGAQGVDSLNSMSALICVNSTLAASFCITYGVNCQFG
jgi:mersacidin/lichenicidin family type 2 lantibiotic